MAVWGVDSGTVQEELLSPLGLICYGGRTNEKGMTYNIYSKNKDGFNVDINEKDLKNIKNIYINYKKEIRRKKLEKIKQIYES